MYLVFGATGGIGSSLAQRLLKHEGASVVLAGRNEAKLQEVSTRIGGGLPFVADGCNAKGAEAAVQQAVKEFGRLDGVACCIGNLALKSIHVTSEEEVRVRVKELGRKCSPNSWSEQCTHAVPHGL